MDITKNNTDYDSSKINTEAKNASKFIKNKINNKGCYRKN